MEGEDKHPSVFLCKMNVLKVLDGLSSSGAFKLIHEFSCVLCCCVSLNSWTIPPGVQSAVCQQSHGRQHDYCTEGRGTELLFIFWKTSLWKSWCTVSGSVRRSTEQVQYAPVCVESLNPV